MAEVQHITIEPLELRWSVWARWSELAADTRLGGIGVPNGVSGVYEVRYEDAEERLTIGKAANLRFRVKRGSSEERPPTQPER